MEDEQIDELRTAVARFVRRLKAEKHDGQLGDTHIVVVMLLARDGPHTLTELSDYVRVTPPSMSQTVRSLVASGLVAKESDPTDGRKVLLILTDAGSALAAETSRRRHHWLAQQLEGLSSEDTLALIKASQILRRVADG